MSGAVRFGCPCCGYPTLRDRSGAEPCYLCCWHEGAASSYTLAEACANWEAHRTMFRPADATPFDKSKAGRALREVVAERLTAFRHAAKAVLSNQLLGEIEIARRRILWSNETGELA